MKNLVLALSLVLSTSAFAQKLMSKEATEMFELLTHAQVKECLEGVDVKLANLKIQKNVFRCRGCNTYVITGNKPSSDEKTVITLKGKGFIGRGGKISQTYECSVEE